MIALVSQRTLKYIVTHPSARFFLHLFAAVIEPHLFELSRESVDPTPALPMMAGVFEGNTGDSYQREDILKAKSESKK
jgi:hypothetical protein